MKTYAMALSALLGLISSTALAQHADIRPYVENGQIQTAGFCRRNEHLTPVYARVRLRLR